MPEYNPDGEFSTILQVYESKPVGEGPFPTIILFMHAHGVDDSMQKVCDDLVKEGYYAVGADAYLKGKYDFNSRTDGLIFTSFDLLLLWLKKNEVVDHSRLGLIGFCMGGRHVYLASANYPNFNAGVAYYGFPHRGSSQENTPQNIIERFQNPILSIFGSEDKGIPMNVVEKYREVSTQINPQHKSLVYEGAGHGFLNPYSNNHDLEASQSAWEETIQYLDKFVK